MSREGSERSDRLIGTWTDDTLNGYAGDDHIDGMAGNDVLLGGQGDDVLEGSEGDDLLDGGEGNDVLSGGLGGDVYQFYVGSGNDTIRGAGFSATEFDVVSISGGVVPDEVSVARSFNDLIISIINTDDQLTISGYFPSDGSTQPYSINSIRFDDGTNWDFSAVSNQLLQVTESDDELIFGNGADIATGNDVYLFELGGGQDLLSSFDPSQGKQDVLRFGVGILPEIASDARMG